MVHVGEGNFLSLFRLRYGREFGIARRLSAVCSIWMGEIRVEPPRQILAEDAVGGDSHVCVVFHTLFCEPAIS